MAVAPETIEVPVWHSNGRGMMVRCEALPADHPMQTWNYIERVYGVNPALYGIEKPTPQTHGEIGRG